MLASASPAGSFATRRVTPTGDLQLSVRGVGELALPVTATAVRRLCERAQRARYGLRDRTLLDTRVRDGWEIARREIQIDRRPWHKVFDAQLAQLAQDLGVPAGCTLRAELHNLLIYGPGQFFATHQDSEKADGMVGTLVVVLPSVCKGGALVIKHHDEKVICNGTPDRLTWIAFYADCHHEVRKVTQGYRVVLTYNLFLDGTARVDGALDASQVDKLTRHVRSYFTTRQSAHAYRDGEAALPDRLIYLLDHQYTQKGLSWRALKRGDAIRAAMLRQVASALDCEVSLALADVHETWACEEESDEHAYGGREDDYDEERDDDRARDAKRDGHSLIELCDSDIELRHWVRPDGGRTELIASAVSFSEMCYTKASAELAPFASEHEGYTGNEGNTVERWYHRAAVVLWPRSRAFAMRARAAPGWAIQQLARLPASARERTRTMANQLAPFWHEVARRDRSPELAAHCLRVAVALQDPALATIVLQPLRLDELAPRSARHWHALLARHGHDWCWNILGRWATAARVLQGQLCVTLPEWCRRLVAAGGAEARVLVRSLVGRLWSAVDHSVTQLVASPPSGFVHANLERKVPAIVGLLRAASTADDQASLRAIAKALSSERQFPVQPAIAVLRAAHAKRAVSELSALGDVHRDCGRQLMQLLDTPVRRADDWSIATVIRCRCALCRQLARFLVARDQREPWNGRCPRCAAITCIAPSTTTSCR